MAAGSSSSSRTHRHTVNADEALTHTAAMLDPPHRFESRHTNTETQAGITDSGSDSPEGAGHSISSSEIKSTDRKFN